MLYFRYRSSKFELYDIPMSRNDYREVGSGQVNVPEESLNVVQTPSISSSSSLKSAVEKEPKKRVANEPISKPKKKKPKKKKKKPEESTKDNVEPVVCIIVHECIRY